MTRLFDEIPQQTLQTEATQQLREAILNGVFAPGSRLNPGQIATQLGASAGTARAALSKLEEEGLVRNIPFHGMFVTEIDRQRAEELYGVRGALEGYGIRLAAQRITPAELTNLAQTVRQMQEAARQGAVDQLVQHDLAFHRSLLEIAGNHLLLQTWSTLQGQIQRVLSFRYHGYGNLPEIADSHLSLLAALQHHDADAADAALTLHIQQAFADFMARWPLDEAIAIPTAAETISD